MTSTTKGAAVAAACCFGVIAVFQLVLALGAPFGSAAWGGQHRILPTGLRVASFVAIGVYGLFGVLILARGRVRSSRISPTIVNRGSWLIAVLLGLGVLANVASTSGWERYFWAPFAAITAGLCVYVARSPRIV